MTYFPQNPISSPNRFGATPPRNPREAADAIMAYLDREAAGAAMPRTPFAPFLAETYEPPMGGGEGGYAPSTSFDAPYAFDPVGVDEEEETERPLPYPDAQTDDERIENVLWLMENSQSGADAQPGTGAVFGIENLFGLIGAAEAASGGRKPNQKFDILAVAEAARNSIRNGALRQLFRLWRNRIREVEPFHPLLTQKPADDYVPSQEELDALEQEHAAAERRAALRKALKARRIGGETVHTIRGRASHNLFDVDTEARKGSAEVAVPGGRIDRVIVNPQTNEADTADLKPRTNRSTRRYERQAERNATSYEENRGNPTSWALHFYEVQDVVDWLRGELDKLSR